MLEQAMRKFFEINDLREERLRLQYRAARHRSTVAQYNDYFLRVVVQLPDLSDAQQIHDYINGLQPELASRVREVAPTSLAHAMTSALDKERFYSRRSPPAGQTRGRPPYAREHPRSDPMIPYQHRFARPPADSPAPAPARTSRDVTQITCYICAKRGHYARDCPDAPKMGNKPTAPPPTQTKWDNQRKAYLKSIGISLPDSNSAQDLHVKRPSHPGKD